LYYLPHAGRGELTRLIAAVGGLELEEKSNVMDKASFGSPGIMPCLAHGDLKISQSFAIESYIARIAPGFAGLNPAQRAVDEQFCKMKESMVQDFLAILTGVTSNAGKMASVIEDVAAVADKWIPTVVSQLPSDGFVHGLAFPSPADLAVLNMARGFMPFGAAYGIGNYDVFGKHPQFAAHAARVAKHGPVKAYLEKSQTMDADLYGIKSPASRQPNSVANLFHKQLDQIHSERISAMAAQLGSTFESRFREDVMSRSEPLDDFRKNFF
jgi:hypothetical protein